VIVKNKILNAILWAIFQTVKQLLFFIVCILMGRIICHYVGWLTTIIISVIGLIVAMSIEKYKNTKQ